MRDRLTSQQEQFARLVAEGSSFVGAYRLIYRPRNGTRSARAELVAAKRVAHRPLVEQRIEQLREELLASDPVEMRRRANVVLGKILVQDMDPRYRRTALDVLKRLDEQERAAGRADREAYRTIVAQMAAIDAIEGGGTKRVRSTSSRPRPKEQPQVDIDQLIEEIAQIAEERRRSSELAPPLVLDSCPDPSPPAREATQLLKVAPEPQDVISREQELPVAGKEQIEAILVEVVEVKCDYEASEQDDVKIPELTTADDTIGLDVPMAASEAPEMVAEYEQIPGYFPQRFRRRVRRLG